MRKFNIQTDLDRDKQLYAVMGQNPNKVFSLIKSFKNTHGGAVAKLKVGDKTYHGENVPDGFFESMSSLKKCDIESLKAIPDLADKLLDYETVIELCQTSQGLPPVDLDTSTKLLH